MPTERLIDGTVTLFGQPEPGPELFGTLNKIFTSIIIYISYFWGRTDVYSKRSVNKKTGKAGYYPQCDNFSRWDVDVCPRHSGQKMRCIDCEFRMWTKLKPAAIKRHLLGSEPDGSDVIGVYPLFPDGTCRFLVFDFDNHDKGAEANDYANTDNHWIEEVDAMRAICQLFHRHQWRPFNPDEPL